MASTGIEFQDRQLWDAGTWPELHEVLTQLQRLVLPSAPGIALNLMVFNVASQASGCRHCQAHTAFGLNRFGTSIDKIQALWSFETSTLFDDRERAALRFALAAGSTPNAVGPEHHAALREHFTDDEVRTLFAVVAMSGFMNRFNDSLAVVTDRASSEWAAEHIGPVGWSIGKHVGAAHEQRADL